MIRLLLLSLACMSSAVAGPLDLTWQSRLVDTDGTPLNGPQSLELRLCAGATGSCTLWSDTFSTTASDGYVSLTLAVTTEVLQQDQVWVEVEANSTVLAPRHKLASVPFAGITRAVLTTTDPESLPCSGSAGDIVFDITSARLLVCDGSHWLDMGARPLKVDNAYRYADGVSLSTCGDYLTPPTGYAPITSDGLYWVDPDGSGGSQPFQAWCDQTLDGGGWMLVAWATSQTSFEHGRTWVNYQGATPTVEPTTRGFSNRLSSLPATFGGANLDVRQTYRQAVDQSTLDIQTGTTRAITLGSTWTGTLSTTNPLPSNTTRETVNHNCTGYTYVSADGSAQTLNDRGCYVEYTNLHSGGWAACGSNTYDSGGAVFNLCFDNSNTTADRGNSVLGLWHMGAMSYHEVYEHNFNTDNPANGAWASTGGDWTWSTWLRAQ